MSKFNWRALIGTVAPTLGAALGGPLGGMAGAVVSKIVLGRDKATEAELSTALMNATPDQLLALKKADQEFAVQMKSLDVDVFKLETVDVQSARAMYAVNYWPQITITTLYIAGYFIILAMILSGKVAIPGDMRETATVLIGMLSTAIPMILGFWFGSSFGSREKTAALAVSTPADKGN